MQLNKRCTPLTTACSERAVSRVRTKMMVCPSFSHCKAKAKDVVRN